MENKVRWFEAAFWMVLAILTGGIMVAVVCCAAWHAISHDLKFCGASKAILAVASLIVFVVAWAFNGMSRRNYRTCRQLIEEYSYKEWLIGKFKDLRNESNEIVNQSVLESGKNIDESADKNASIAKPVTAIRTDYKLFEMLIESLADDPSKRMFA